MNTSLDLGLIFTPSVASPTCSSQVSRRLQRHTFLTCSPRSNKPFPKLGEKYPLGTQLDPWFGRLTAKAHNRRFQRANEALEALNQIVPKPDHPTHEKKLFSPSKTVTVTQLRLKAKPSRYGRYANIPDKDTTGSPS